jgi:hypothetical protein
MKMMMTYPSWIDDDSQIEDTFGDGERAIRFLRHLRHPKSTAPGRAFQLDRWMERIIRRRRSRVHHIPFRVRDNARPPLLSEQDGVD